MINIKQKPEDFIVNEISEPRLTEKGDYAYYILEKKNLTTSRAISIVSRWCKIPVKNIGFAGNKDKIALTTQQISIKGGIKNMAFEGPEIKLSFLGFSNEPLTLGKLVGNKFTIKVFSDSKPKKIDFMANYFDEQRFSEMNSEIGEAIVKKDFRKATELITEFKFNIKNNEYVNALTQLPKHQLLMYIHAFQSKIFNSALSTYTSIKSKKSGSISVKKEKLFTTDERLENIKLPLIGYATEFRDPMIKDIYSTILLDYELKLRDFVIRQIPWLSSEGNERDAFVEVQNLKINKVKEGEWVLEFFLDKGSYATIAVKSIFK